MLGVGDSGSCIRLLAPLSPESTIAKFLEKSGPGIQQVAYGVDDVEEAAQTSHIAIVARSLGIPLIGGVEGVADAARAGDRIVVDAEAGEVHVRPPGEVVAAFQAKQALLAQRVARFAAIRDEPAVTRDGAPLDAAEDYTGSNLLSTLLIPSARAPGTPSG